MWFAASWARRWTGRTGRVGGVGVAGLSVAAGSRSRSRSRSGVARSFRRGGRVVRTRASKVMRAGENAMLGFEAMKGSACLMIMVEGGVVGRVARQTKLAVPPVRRVRVV